MDNFLKFLKRSITVYHAADTITDRLKKAGFSEIKEVDAWKLKPKGKYFLKRAETLITAFIVPEKKPISATLLATHIDRPCLKLKPLSVTETKKIGQLATEVYGAPLLHTWLDRDLVIAGKVDHKTVTFDKHPVIIPSLALHLDREVQEKGVKVHKHDHLKAIFSLDSKKSPIKKHLYSNLFLVPLEPPAYLGKSKEMIASYGLDNLTTSYAVMEAIANAKPTNDTLSIAYFFDHEEIGSISTQGADSTFTAETLERICFSLKMEKEDLYRLKAKSLCISGDLVHGFHPNYSDKFDPENASYLGKGVSIKYNANQRYATSIEGIERILMIASKHKIPMQHFATRSNIPTGSTLGPMISAMSGIQTVDLGISGIAMHSIRETVSTEDMVSLCKLLEKVLQ